MGSGVDLARGLDAWGAWGGSRGRVLDVSGAGVTVARWWRYDRAGAMHVGGEGVDCGAHRSRVLRRGAAAAAYDSRSRREHLRNHVAEVRRPGRVDELTFDALREPRVGGDGSGHSGAWRPGSDERLQADEWAGAAVDAHCVDARLNQGYRGRLGRRAIVEGHVFAEGHLRDDRQVAGSARLFDRQENAFEAVERLQDQDVGPAFGQALDLLAEGSSGYAGMGAARHSTGWAE